MSVRTSLACLLAALMAGSGCCRTAAPAAEPAEPPTLDVTHWTRQSELFMEHPPSGGGPHRALRRAPHRAADFSALTVDDRVSR